MLSCDEVDVDFDNMVDGGGGDGEWLDFRILIFGSSTIFPAKFAPPWIRIRFCVQRDYPRTQKGAVVT